MRCHLLDLSREMPSGNCRSGRQLGLPAATVSLSISPMRRSARRWHDTGDRASIASGDGLLAQAAPVPACSGVGRRRMRCVASGW